jgi:hypothetical protein
MADKKERASGTGETLGESQSEVDNLKSVYTLRAEQSDSEIVLPKATAGNVTEVALYVIRVDDGSSGHEARIATKTYPIQISPGQEAPKYRLSGFEMVRLYAVQARWYVIARSSLSRLGSVGKVPALESKGSGAQPEVVSDLEELRRAVNQLIDRSRERRGTVKSGRLDADFSESGSILTSTAV